jgi:hypothetical protein
VDIEMKLKVANVQVVSWQVEGMWCEDHYKPYNIFMVVAEIEGGYKGFSALVHEVRFPELRGDDWQPEAEARAEALAARIARVGLIDDSHWCVDEFFSLSLEQRLNEEAYHEDMHRKGHGHLSKGVFSTGHE